MMGEETRRWKTAIGLMLAGLIVCAALTYSGGGNSGETIQAKQMTEAEKTEAAENEWKQLLISAAKKDVANALRDPESAIFGAVVHSKKRGEAICGTVNAKNAFGGYTGMQPFVITLPGGSALINDAAAWNRHCSGVTY
jgi:hypothetical protein